MLEFNESNLNTALTGQKPVVIDFWASWCGPCRAAAPTFQQWSDKYGDKAVFGKVNTDDEHSISVENNISALPTFIVFKDGKESKRFVGMPNEKDLLEAIS